MYAAPSWVPHRWPLPSRPAAEPCHGPGHRGGWDPEGRGPRLACAPSQSDLTVHLSPNKGPPPTPGKRHTPRVVFMDEAGHGKETSHTRSTSALSGGLTTAPRSPGRSEGCPASLAHSTAPTEAACNSHSSAKRGVK